MKILKDVESVRPIIEECAKYQKVMLIYDESVSMVQVSDIYEQVRDLCIFNKIDITADKSELNNGYRLLIFLCSGDSFLRFSAPLGEFVNIFLPTDSCILPFFLQGYHLAERDDYLILKQNRTDLNVFSSMIFNQFLLQFQSIIGITEQEGDDEKFLFSEEFTQKSAIKLINSVKNKENLKFFDLELLVASNMDYRDTMLLDYVLLCACSVFIQSVSGGQLALTDVYKVAKDDCGLVDKFYAMSQNTYLIEMTRLNSHYLNRICERAKQEVLSLLALSKLNMLDLASLSIFRENQSTDGRNDTSGHEHIARLIKSIKQALPNNDSLLGYLYFYDVI